jgi:hypothetical protein
LDPPRSPPSGHAPGSPCPPPLGEGDDIRSGVRWPGHWCSTYSRLNETAAATASNAHLSADMTDVSLASWRRVYVRMHRRKCPQVACERARTTTGDAPSLHTYCTCHTDTTRHAPRGESGVPTRADSPLALIVVWLCGATSCLEISAGCWAKTGVWYVLHSLSPPRHRWIGSISARHRHSNGDTSPIVYRSSERAGGRLCPAAATRPRTDGGAEVGARRGRRGTPPPGLSVRPWEHLVSQVSAAPSVGW